MWYRSGRNPFNSVVDLDQGGGARNSLLHCDSGRFPTFSLISSRIIYGSWWKKSGKDKSRCCEFKCGFIRGLGEGMRYAECLVACIYRGDLILATLYKVNNQNNTADEYILCFILFICQHLRIWEACWRSCGLGVFPSQLWCSAFNSSDFTQAFQV